MIYCYACEREFHQKPPACPTCGNGYLIEKPHEAEQDRAVTVEAHGYRVLGVDEYCVFDLMDEWTADQP